MINPALFRRKRRSGAGTLYRYAVGDSLAAASFARTSAATFDDVGMVVQTAISGAVRDGHYYSSIRTLLLEAGSTNLCLQSENFGTTWLTTSAPTRVAAAHTASGVTLDLIGDSSAVAGAFYRQDVTYTGDGTKAHSEVRKKGLSPAAGGDQVSVRDQTASVDRLLGTITWDGSGVPSVAMTTGTYLGAIPLGGGAYRFLFRTTAVVAANVNRIRCGAGRFATVTADVGDVYIGGIMVEDRATPTSYIKTTTGIVSRSADLLKIPVSTLTPQEMTIYLKLFELGPQVGVNLFIGTTGATPPYLDVANNGATSTTARHNPAGAPVTSLVNPDPATNDTVELRIVLGANGTINIGRSINGAAETTGGASSGVALTATWGATPVLALACDPSGNQTCMAIRSVKILKRTKTMAEMRSA